MNNSKHPDGTPAMTFQKPAGEANPYVWFGYGSHKIYNHNRVKVSVSMNSDLINANKKVNNERHKNDN